MEPRAGAAAGVPEGVSDAFPDAFPDDFPDGAAGDWTGTSAGFWLMAPFFRAKG
jgi:hypothetical protein